MQLSSPNPGKCREISHASRRKRNKRHGDARAVVIKGPSTPLLQSHSWGGLWVKNRSSQMCCSSQQIRVTGWVCWDCYTPIPWHSPMPGLWGSKGTLFVFACMHVCMYDVCLSRPWLKSHCHMLVVTTTFDHRTIFIVWETKQSKDNINKPFIIHGSQHRVLTVDWESSLS